MKLVDERNHDVLDDEWIELMRAARRIGITPEEIRQFLSDMTVDN